jgi:hypothetical protein
MPLEERILELIKQLEEEKRLSDKRAKQLFNLFSPESWIAPTLLNSWVNYGGGTTPAGYYKDSFGIVHLRGLIKDGTLASAAFVLPAGYRPVNQEDFCQITSGGAGRCLIYAAGSVIPQTGGNSWYSLAGITFRAA